MAISRRRYSLIVIVGALAIALIVAGSYWLGHTTSTAADKSTTAANELATVQATLRAVQADLNAHSQELATLKAEQQSANAAGQVVTQILEEAGVLTSYIEKELVNLCNATRGCSQAPTPLIAPATTTTITGPPNRPAIIPPPPPTTTTTVKPHGHRRLRQGTLLH